MINSFAIVPLFPKWVKRISYNCIHNRLEDWLRCQVAITITWIIPLQMSHEVVSWTMVCAQIHTAKSKIHGELQPQFPLPSVLARSGAVLWSSDWQTPWTCPQRKKIRGWASALTSPILWFFLIVFRGLLLCKCLKHVGTCQLGVLNLALLMFRVCCCTAYALTRC